MTYKCYSFGPLAPSLADQGLPLPADKVAHYDSVCQSLYWMLTQRVYASHLPSMWGGR